MKDVKRVQLKSLNSSSMTKDLARVVFLTARFPWPLNKGDKLRAFHQIKGLSAHHEVHLFALSDEAVTPEALAALQPYCASIEIAPLPLLARVRGMLRALTRQEPLQTGYFCLLYTSPSPRDA